MCAGDYSFLGRVTEGCLGIYRCSLTFSKCLVLSFICCIDIDSEYIVLCFPVNYMLLINQ